MYIFSKFGKKHSYVSSYAKNQELQVSFLPLFLRKIIFEEPMKWVFVWQKFRQKNCNHGWYPSNASSVCIADFLKSNVSDAVLYQSMMCLNYFIIRINFRVKLYKSLSRYVFLDTLSTELWIFGSIVSDISHFQTS